MTNSNKLLSKSFLVDIPILTLMSVEVSEEVKKTIFRLISEPGVEIEDIVKKVHLDREIVMKILSDEYGKNDLDQGRRLCCRF